MRRNTLSDAARLLRARSQRGPNGCLEWCGSRDSWGYGLINVNGKKCIKTHRLAWALLHGPIPRGLLVCHSCDNPACIEPSHLWLGTDKENTRDSIKKGRFHSKLKDKEVLSILKRYTGARCQQRDLAKEYGVSIQTINDLLHGRTWARLSVAEPPRTGLLQKTP